MILSSSQKLKEKMLELTKLFCIERDIFQRLVIVYKYIKLLNTDPLAKNILQKIFDDTAHMLGDVEAKQLDEEKFVDVKGEALYSQKFWIYYSNLETIHNRMKAVKKCQVRDKKEFKKLRNLFSKPYSKKMFELSFEVVNSEMFDKMDEDCFLTKPNKEKKSLV